MGRIEGVCRGRMTIRKHVKGPAVDEGEIAPLVEQRRNAVVKKARRQVVATIQPPPSRMD
eukprot:1817630-Rhodomonas_salina.1